MTISDLVPKIPICSHPWEMKNCQVLGLNSQPFRSYSPLKFGTLTFFRGPKIKSRVAGPLNLQLFVIEVRHKAENLHSDYFFGALSENDIKIFIWVTLKEPCASQSAFLTFGTFFGAFLSTSYALNWWQIKPFVAYSINMACDNISDQMLYLQSAIFPV